MKKYFLAIVIITSVQFYSQGKYHVEFNEINGVISKEDKFKADFGKYDGYEIPLYAGERLNVNLLTNEFNGKLFLINPKGEVYKFSKSDKNGVANINAVVPADGEWIIYVVGDTKAFGRYLIQYGLADINTQAFPMETDFCSSLLFLAEHSIANFMLMEDYSKPNARMPRLFGSIDNYMEEDEPVFNSIFYSGSELRQAKEMFAKVSSDVEICLGESFKKLPVKRVKGEIEKLIFVSKEKGEEKEISVQVLDQKEMNAGELSRYQVVVKVKRK